MSHSFIQNYCWITLQVSHHEGWKTCVKKWKVKMEFFEVPETGWWLDLTDPDPLILQEICSTASLWVHVQSIRMRLWAEAGWRWQYTVYCSDVSFPNGRCWSWMMTWLTRCQAVCYQHDLQMRQFCYQQQHLMRCMHLVFWLGSARIWRIF